MIMLKTNNTVALFYVGEAKPSLLIAERHDDIIYELWFCGNGGTPL